MGLAVAHQLAAKGANVVIVARDQSKLLDGLAHVKVRLKRISRQSRFFDHES